MISATFASDAIVMESYKPPILLNLFLNGAGDEFPKKWHNGPPILSLLEISVFKSYPPLFHGVGPLYLHRKHLHIWSEIYSALCFMRFSYQLLILSMCGLLLLHSMQEIELIIFLWVHLSKLRGVEYVLGTCKPVNWRCYSPHLHLLSLKRCEAAGMIME